MANADGAAADRRRASSSSPDNALDLDPDEVQVVTLWDKEARKEDLYKIENGFRVSSFLTFLLKNGVWRKGTVKHFIRISA